MSASNEDSRPGAQAAELATGVTWNVASLAVLGLAGIALNVLIGRFYGAASLGVFNQVMGAYILFSMAAAGGINYSLLRAVAQDPHDRARVAGAVVGALLPTVLLALVVTSLFYWSRHWIAAALDSGDVAIGMRAATPGLFCFAINKQLLAVVNGMQRMRAFAVYQALRYVLILGGFLLAWRLDFSGAQLSFVWTFAEGLLLVVLAIEVMTQIAWRQATGVLHWSREHVVFGARSVLSAMLLELNAKVDIWMLGLSLDDARVGVYSLAANLAEGFYQLIVVLQNNFNPLLANQVARGATVESEELIRGARRWIVPSFALAALLAAAVYPWTLPLLTADPSFQDSWLSFSILVGAMGVLAAWLPFGNILLMAGRPATHSLLMVIVVLVNVFANWLLIPRFGIEGAAAGTAVAFCVFALLLKILARVQTGVRL